jgi:hypothetical protein
MRRQKLIQELMSVILAMEEVERGRITVQDQPGQKVFKTSSQPKKFV